MRYFADARQLENSMLIPILGGLVTIFACFFVYVATRPSTFRVTRAERILLVEWNPAPHDVPEI